MAVPSFQRLVDDVQRQLPPRKFHHVLGVTHAAAALAFRHGEDPSRAALAGFLHDISKERDPEDIRSEMRRRGYEIDPEDEPYPRIWHGFHAAVLAREFLKENGRGDAQKQIDEMATALEQHSTAGEAMSRLGKILFVADYTEPTRNHPGVEELRELARRDLDAAFRLCLERKVRHMMKKHETISPRARRAMKYYGLQADALA